MKYALNKEPKSSLFDLVHPFSYYLKLKIVNQYILISNFKFYSEAIPRVVPGSERSVLLIPHAVHGHCDGEDEILHKISHRSLQVLSQHQLIHLTNGVRLFVSAP